MLKRWPQILFRGSLGELNEEEIARKHFSVINHRTMVGQNELIIGRYSVLPFYQELEDDIDNLDADLINTFTQHRYIADIKSWYADLEGLTPKTWFRVCDVPTDEPGPFVLKGETNSRKHMWATHMFAQDRATVSMVHHRLLDDSMIGQQDIYVRRFEQMKIWPSIEGLNGLPVTNEWRIFVCYGEMLAQGFYWSEHFDQIVEKHELPEAPPKRFIDDVISRITVPTFYVIVVGQRSDGSWFVVELNDGQMSGLSMVDADELYSNLKRVVEKHL